MRTSLLPLRYFSSAVNQTNANIGEPVDQRDSSGRDYDDFESPVEPELVDSIEFEIDRDDLTPHQYYCLFGNGVERAFTGNLFEFDEIGTYHCGGCDTPLFR